MMKLLLLGAANSIHLQRWANALAASGLQVGCASAQAPLQEGWHADVIHHPLPYGAGGGSAAYLLNIGALRRLLARGGYALLHAHYASGYGLLATVANARPRLVSAWGSDVVEFAARSPLHRLLLRRVLRGADALAATSASLAERVQDLLAPQQSPVCVTPFGVDLRRFVPPSATADPSGEPLLIGTVKTLAPVYGVDLLIEAFARLPPHNAGGRALRLRLVGDGPDRAALEALCAHRGVRERVDFVGSVAHAEVPAELRRLDIYVAASRQESFGVAVLEASACARPVVVTRVGGLPEVVVDGVSGLLVPPEDVGALAAALAALVDDAPRRAALGAAGRRHVRAHYDWDDSVERMLALYRSLLDSAAVPTVPPPR